MILPLELVALEHGLSIVLILILEIFCFFSAVAGVASLTWWLTRRAAATSAAVVPPIQPKPAAPSLPSDPAVAELQTLIARVAVDVADHTSEVAEATALLSSGGVPTGTKLRKIIARLVEANQHMEQRLAATETKLQEQARQIKSQTVEARTDPLTLLANRRWFDEEIARRLAEYRRQQRIFSIVMVDVDRFKKFNNLFGHRAGDEVLRHVARVLRRTTREMDLVVRYGGEEFVAILPGTPLQGAGRVALRIRNEIMKKRIRYERRELCVTVSLGVAEVTGSETAAQLIERADAALYASKRSGRNCAHGHDGGKCLPISESKSTSTVGVLRDVGDRGSFLAEDADRPISDISLDMAENMLPRAAFCQQVRSRLAEYKRGGAPFAVVLLAVNQYQELMALQDAPMRESRIRALARFMQGAVREMDTVGFFNPGCCSLLLPGAELPAALGIAERLRRTVEERELSVEPGGTAITISLGVACAGDCDDFVLLLQRAENALEQSKRSGGNSAYYHDGERTVPVQSALPERAHNASRVEIP